MNSKTLLYQIIILLFTIISSCTDIQSKLFPSKHNSNNISTVVDLYGQLSINGNKIISQHGDTVVLKGMSLYWSQWMNKFYNYKCVKWLRDDWKCSVLRAAVGVEREGYISNPEREMGKIKTVIDACIDLGIYVIVDWHSHSAHENTDEAIAFFREIATLYGDKPNIIYEIYNEPLEVSWDSVIKPYADTVIKAIREIDTNNIIVVGTPRWSQDVDVASNNPITGKNIAYALHYYASTHKQELRDKASKAIEKGCALFVTEFGTCEYNGDGHIDYEENKYWFDFMDKNKISWCNWSIADVDETSSALKDNANAMGHWKISDLSESGIYIKNKLLEMNGKKK